MTSLDALQGGLLILVLIACVAIAVSVGFGSPARSIAPVPPRAPVARSVQFEVRCSDPARCETVRMRRRIASAAAAVTKALTEHPAKALQTLTTVVLDLDTHYDKHGGYAACAEGTIRIVLPVLERASGDEDGDWLGEDLSRRVAWLTHHEVGHLLICEHGMPAGADWGPRADHGVVEDQVGAWRAGFVTAYAASTPADDVCDTLAGLMTAPAHVVLVGTSQARVAEKALAVDAWYEAIAPGVSLLDRAIDDTVTYQRDPLQVERGR